MDYFDYTFPSPAENLACDEALLDLCANGHPREILRIWEPPSHFVVLGYSNTVHAAVHRDACRTHRIPILRRCSGGGTVLQGPGCLNVSLIVQHNGSGPFASPAGTTRYILQRHREVLQSLVGQPVELHGVSDLTIRQRKVSGNAQRRKRHAVLFHGTFLLALDLTLVEQILPMPLAQPSYRQHRSHADFLANLPIARERLTEALRAAWKGHRVLQDVPLTQINRLAETRYATDAWTCRF